MLAVNSQRSSHLRLLSAGITGVITGGRRDFSLPLVVVLVPGGERVEAPLNTLQCKEEPLPLHGKHARQTEPLGKGWP